MNTSSYAHLGYGNSLWSYRKSTMNKTQIAARIVVGATYASVSLIQRTMMLDYDRASELMDELEQLGIVSPFDGVNARQVLVANEKELHNIFYKKQ